MPSARPIKVNRAPVLTLWAAVVAERLGFERAEALTLGRAVAGLSAHAKGVALGLIEPAPDEVGEQRRRLRALSHERPIAPASVERYLAGKFGAALDEVGAALTDLTSSLPPEELGRRAFALYERFRPAVPPGERGWGAAGVLDLARVRELARASAPQRP